MKRSCVSALAGVMLMMCAPALAQERGYWHAASSTAKAITGDVAISSEKITLNFQSFIIAQIRELQPSEVSAIFDAESGNAGSGNLYRLDIANTVRMQHKNTLCGTEDTQWMVTYAAGKSLQVAFFSSSKMPVLTPEAIASSTDLCGTFAYTK